MDPGFASRERIEFERRTQSELGFPIGVSSLSFEQEVRVSKEKENTFLRIVLETEKTFLRIVLDKDKTILRE